MQGWPRSGWTETNTALALSLAGVGVLAAVLAFPDQLAFTALVLPLVLGSLLLGPRTTPPFVAFMLVLLGVAVVQRGNIQTRTVTAVIVIVLLGALITFTSFRRAGLGVAGVRGESMLVDLRDRILSQGGIPLLPPGWLVESALHSAGGTAFAGDFVVATKCTRSGGLQLVVVDVSGKGEQAGTRALLLSGAFGGLLGALPPEQFLPAANDYLLRQDWDEGFATAVHLSIDTTTGDFEVRTAGHPPPALRKAGPGRWQVLHTEGPVLGLIEDADFGVARGNVGSGDTLLLYTDGMVEEPRKDIEIGIDRMLGAAESLVRHSWQGAAEQLARTVGATDDDRALLVVHRI